MFKTVVKLFILISFFSCLSTKEYSYDSTCLTCETKEEFNNRMEWYRDSKIGAYYDFGLYNMFEDQYNGYLASDSSSILYHAYIKPDDYSNYIKNFDGDKINIKMLVYLAKISGIKYIVIPAKNKDGFCLFNSKYTDYNIVKHTKYGKDFFKELTTELKKEGIKVGAVYSILDWHHDTQAKFIEDGKRDFVSINSKVTNEGKVEYLKYMYNQLEELIVDYKIDSIVFDGDWVEWWLPEDAFNLRTYLRSLNKKLIVNNKIGRFDFLTGDFDTFKGVLPLNHKRPRDWEFFVRGYIGRNPIDNTVMFNSSSTIIKQLTDVFTRGGNVLFSVKPNKNNNISKNASAVFKDVGKWINRNAEAIYDSRGLNIKFPFLIDHTIYGGMTINEDKNTLYLYLKSDLLKKLNLLNKLFLPRKIISNSTHDVYYKRAYLLTDEGRKEISISFYDKTGRATVAVTDENIKEMKNMKVPVIAVEYVNCIN